MTEHGRAIDQHTRYHLHSTPTSASWRNMVERCYAEIGEKRIRRGTFNCVHSLELTIEGYLGQHNKYPSPFVMDAKGLVSS